MASPQLFPQFSAVVSPSSLSQLRHVGYKRVTVEQPLSFDDNLSWHSTGSLLEVTAPSGYGKSTVLPLSLAKSKKEGLVLLAAVNEFAAAAAHRRMSTTNRFSANVSLHLDPNIAVPRSGVVVTTAAVVIAMIAMGSVKQVAHRSTLIIDDANSPMPITSALRRVAPSMSFESVLAVDSFTAGGTSLQAHNIGKFADAMYTPDSFKDPWSVTEKRSPWSISAMESHSLILMDSDARAADLMQAYAMNGVPCLRWKKKMSVDSFLADLEFIENSTNKDVVVIAHSNFRYGIMLPFGTIIDTAMKDGFLSEGSSAAVSTIPINRYEMLKGKHRGGHFAGVYTVHWSPKGVVDFVADSKMTASDASFETLAIAACGYISSSVVTLPLLTQTRMIDDLPRLFNSELPLSSVNCRANVEKKPFDDTYKSFGCSVPEVVLPQQQSKLDSIFGEINQLLDDIDSQPESFQSDFDGVHFGKYAIVSESVTVSARSPLFPNGAKSLSKLLSKTDDLDVLLGAWDEYDRNVASNIACNSYNAEMISVKALTTLIRRVKTERTMSRTALQTWSRDLADELAAHVMEARRWYATMIYASHDLFPILYDKLEFSNEEKSIVESRAAEIRRSDKVGTITQSTADRDKLKRKPVNEMIASSASVSTSSSKTSSTNKRSVRFEPRKRISELPGYNFNDLVASWVGGRTKQYRRSLERKILEI